MNELGEFLKELRGKKSLRQASKDIGISHTYLDSLEKGYDPRTKKERSPTYDVLKKISTYYGVSYIKLLNKAGYEKEAEREALLKSSEVFRNYRKRKEMELTEFYKENEFDLEELLTYDTKLKFRSYIFNYKEKEHLLNYIKDFFFDIPTTKKKDGE